MFFYYWKNLICLYQVNRISHSANTIEKGMTPTILSGGSSYGVMANMLDYTIIVSLILILLCSLSH